MTVYGFAGKVLRVDLTEEHIWEEQLDMEMARSYLGGPGLNTRLAYPLLKPSADPLSPENVIVLGTGLLAGTIVPGASRFYATTKQPMTNSIGTAVGSGRMGHMLKLAGYDNVIITGKAAKPVYLLLADEPMICNAEWLWGKDLVETTLALWEKHDFCGILATGTAAEKLVRMAFAFTDLVGTCGRGGLGAVMGSKNLKAVVARPGSRGIQVADPEKLMSIVEPIYRAMVEEDPLRPLWREHGVLIGWPTWAKSGWPANNFSTMPSEEALRDLYLPEKFYASIEKTLLTCASCPVGDKGYWEITNGQFKGLGHFGSELLQEILPCGLEMRMGSDHNKRLKALDTANRYGFDIVSVIHLISWCVELQERGILSKEDADGVQLKRDYDTLMLMMDKINKREGFGDVLADGWTGAIHRIGKGCEKYAVTIKGLEAFYGDPRLSFDPGAFEQVINTRGACAVAAESPLVLHLRTSDKIWRHCERMGLSDDIRDDILDSPLEFDLAKLTRHVEEFYQFYSSVGFCARQQVQQQYRFDIMYELINAVTGMEISWEEAHRIGERTMNILKAINVREGFSRKDDKFPDKWYEPLKSEEDPEQQRPLMDYYRTKELDQSDIEQLLDDYYTARGWDVKRGVPTKDKLTELGLDEAANELVEMGLI